MRRYCRLRNRFQMTEFHAKRRHCLSDFIVQLARQCLTFQFLSLNQPARKPAQVVLCFFDLLRLLVVPPFEDSDAPAVSTATMIPRPSVNAIIRIKKLMQCDLARTQTFPRAGKVFIVDSRHFTREIKHSLPPRQHFAPEEIPTP